MSRDDETFDDGAAGGPKPRPPKEAAPASAKEGSPEDDDGRELDAQIARYLRLGLPAATLVCGGVAGVLQGAAAVVLVLTAGALVSVIALFWASIRTLVGETALSGADAYALGAPRVEEEKKRAVLRALKDLEFEHSVGKISEEDYQALVARYRAEAKRLLRAIDDDAQPGRQKVEDLVAARLYRDGLAELAPEPYRGASPHVKPAKPKKKKGKARVAEDVAGGAKPLAPAPPSEKKSENAEALPACASCGVRNDADAAFCKKCGARLEGGGEPEEDAEEKPAQETTS